MYTLVLAGFLSKVKNNDRDREIHKFTSACKVGVQQSSGNTAWVEGQCKNVRPLSLSIYTTGWLVGEQFATVHLY